MKRKFPILTVVLFLSIVFVKADSTDFKKLVRKDMHFHSDLERKVIQQLDSNKTPSMLELMLASDKYVMNEDFVKVKAEVDSLVSDLKKSTSKLSLEFKIKTIFQHTHKRFFKKYDEGVLTYDLFRSGYYNCVTGTCLFAHIFNELNIPYVVKETPNHVYLIADPDGLKIPVESTDPKAGYLKPSRGLMNDYIKFLIDNKLITKGELDSNGMDATFNKYYYSRININYRELAGLQYYNLGLFNFDFGKLDEGISYLEKSYFLYQSPRNKMLLSTAYLAYFRYLESYRDTNNVRNIIKLYTLLPDTPRRRIIPSIFHEIRYELLTRRNDEKGFDYYNKRLGEAVTSDTVIHNHLQIIYDFERGRTSILNGDYENGIKFIVAACNKEPDNREFRMAAELGITKQLSTIDDPIERIDKLNELTRIKKEFRNYPAIKYLYAYNYLKLAHRAFIQDNASNARHFLNEFESLKYNNTVDSALFVTVYLESCKGLTSTNEIHAQAKRLQWAISLMPKNTLLIKEYEKIRYK